MRQLVFASLLLLNSAAWASFGNYNSVLIGDRAAGMGGAQTALPGDISSAAYYNPALLALSTGRSLSTSASLFNKYETRFGDQSGFNEAPLRVNKGSILSIPAASGVVQNFDKITLGLSIIMPSLDNFGGEIAEDTNTATTLTLRDEHLWVGGAMAKKIDDRQTYGLTLYYTSRNYTRSLVDRYSSGGDDIIASESRSFYHNSVVGVLGYYRKLNDNWELGFSHRLPSVYVAGRGEYNRSQVGSVSGATGLTKKSNIRSRSPIPQKTTLGFAYRARKERIYTLDVSYYSPENYNDLEIHGDHIQNRAIWNFNLGAELPIYNWVSLRAGVFSNQSSHSDIPLNPAQRQGDHIDMWGFSTTLAFKTSTNTMLSLGGYYSGGKGHAAEEVAGQITRIKKSNQIFSFLVGTSFGF